MDEAKNTIVCIKADLTASFCSACDVCRMWMNCLRWYRYLDQVSLRHTAPTTSTEADIMLSCCGAETEPR